MTTPAPRPLPALIDGRQSQAALDIQRGVGRCLLAHGFAHITELTLASGRRADVVGFREAGDIWIIEVKSSIEDFRADQKWPDYRDFCDRFFFAVAPTFPLAILPEQTGLIIADRYGAEIMIPAPDHKLAPARRKAVTSRIARVAALRLQSITDPELGLEPPPRW